MAIIILHQLQLIAFKSFVGKTLVTMEHAAVQCQNSYKIYNNDTYNVLEVIVSECDCHAANLV